MKFVAIKKLKVTPLVPEIGLEIEAVVYVLTSALGHRLLRQGYPG